MCGIVGYIGTKEAYPILIKGLHRLEYRGYDSAGIALISDNQELNVYKTKGKVADLERFAESKDISGCIGIAHTRWATHGEPNDVNAHPHYSQSKNLALIHNGIIENYTVLRAELENKGYIFRSNTDTEVIVYLVEYIMRTNQVDLCTGVQLALHQVIGAYAIALMDKSNPNEIIAARKSSPLVVGIGMDEFFLASDATPIVEYTDKVVYLNDEEIAVIRRGEPLKVVDLNNVEITPEIKKLAIALQQKCEEEHVNYGIFFSEVSHTITGGATFTLEEIAIMIETIARNLPVEQIKFLQTVLSMVIKEKNENPSAPAQQLTN